MTTTDPSKNEVAFACGHSVSHEEDCPRCDIERLRRDRDEIAANRRADAHQWREAIAERDRLRAALDKIANGGICGSHETHFECPQSEDVCAIARAALSGEPGPAVETTGARCTCGTTAGHTADCPVSIERQAQCRHEIVEGWMSVGLAGGTFGETWCKACGKKMMNYPLPPQSPLKAKPDSTGE